MKKKSLWIATAALVLWLPVIWSAFSSERAEIDERPALVEQSTVPSIAPAPAAEPVARPTRAEPPAPVQPPPAPPPVPTVDESELDEDKAIEAEGNTTEQRAWRSAWVDEEHDDVWTQQVAREIKQRGEAVLRGDLKLHDLSCRETVCRLYLQFADRDDARVFMTEPTEPSLHYEYQRLDPQFDGPGHPSSQLEYELMIVRKDGPVASRRREAIPAEERIDLPGEDELITIVSKTRVEP